MQALRDMWGTFTPTRRTAVLLFLGLFGCYLSLSPGSTAGQGYVGEEMQSGERMLAVANAWLKGRPIPPMLWSRHGPVPVLFDLPFIKLGKMLVSPDFMLSFQPVLLTAGVLTILYLWLRKLSSPGMSLLLTLTGAFGTMLWPYAYIGLETKQSFFVLLAGYLALADGKLRSWPRLLLFAAACGVGMTVKSTGITLWPAIAYLFYVQFRGDWRLRRAQAFAVVLVVGAIWAFGAWGRNFYWAPIGGGAHSLRPWLADSVLQVFANAIGVFGSPTKGLFVYAPVLLASIYAVPRAFRAHREIVIYTLLVTACALGLISLLTSPADDVWGCRYMHVAIPPLLLCIGAAWPSFKWRRDVGLVALAVIGVTISFLGAFYYYGLQDFAAKDAGQNTLEWVTGDPDWNQVVFNARLFRTWLQGGTAPVIWTPKHVWVWSPPPDAQPWKSVDLRKFCEPQSFMVRFWNAPKTGSVLVIFLLYVGSLVMGLLLLTWVVVRTRKHRPTVQRIERTVNDRALCDFYHTVELPDGSLTKGFWDLRGGVEQYLGEVDFSGKSVLEIGPASGFLSFHMEDKGAKVTCIEPPMETFWDLVPRAGVDLESLKNKFGSHVQRIRNSFWYLHSLKHSTVELYEANPYDISDGLGEFDIGLLASILLHCSSPVRMIESVSRRVKDTMIICDAYSEYLGKAPTCGLVPTTDNDTIDMWWHFTPEFFINYLAVLGFRTSRVVRHRQLYLPTNTWHEMFTVVASRS